MVALAMPVTAAPDRQKGGWKAVSQFAIPASPDRCAATAVFRRDEETLRVALDMQPTTEGYALLIEAPGKFGSKRWESSKNFLGSKQLKADYILFERSDRAGTVIYGLKTNRSELESGGANSEFQVRSKSIHFAVPLTALNSALSKLDACAVELLVRWGYSKDFQANLASYPRPERKLGKYASRNDYPVSAVRSGATGEVHALVTVSPSGRASNCRVVRSSGHQGLDGMTCKIVTERARYVPAKALNGDATSAPAYLTFRWELPS
jgi:TonB family protein